MPPPGMSSLISKVGKSKAARYSTMLAAGAGVIAGMHSARVGQRTFDTYTDTLFGDGAQVDQAILGTDVSWGNWVDPMRNPATAIPAGGLVGGVIGAAVGGGSGSPLGMGLGALAGGLLGAGAGAMGTLAPYVNSTILGDTFRKDKGAELALRYAERNAEDRKNRYAMPNSGYGYQAVVTRSGVATDEDYYATGFPYEPGRRRSTTGATGDIVFGMHNLRMG